MPRRSILSAAERESLLALPEGKDELIGLCTFSDTDLAIIGQHRGPASQPTGLALPSSCATCDFPASFWAPMNPHRLPCCAWWPRN